jgi:hypothetical protein
MDHQGLIAAEMHMVVSVLHNIQNVIWGHLILYKLSGGESLSGLSVILTSKFNHNE